MAFKLQLSIRFPPLHKGRSSGTQDSLTPQTLPYSIWLFQSCVLYNNTVNVLYITKHQDMLITKMRVVNVCNVPFEQPFQ